MEFHHDVPVIVQDFQVGIACVERIDQIGCERFYDEPFRLCQVRELTAVHPRVFNEFDGDRPDPKFSREVIAVGIVVDLQDLSIPMLIFAIQYHDLRCGRAFQGEFTVLVGDAFRIDRVAAGGTEGDIYVAVAIELRGADDPFVARFRQVGDRSDNGKGLCLGGIQIATTVFEAAGEKGDLHLSRYKSEGVGEGIAEDVISKGLRRSPYLYGFTSTDPYHKLRRAIRIRVVLQNGIQ